MAMKIKYITWEQFEDNKQEIRSFKEIAIIFVNLS